MAADPPLAIDAADPATWEPVVAAVRRPQPIAALEEIEVGIKAAWAFAAERPITDREAVAFVDFFHRIGYLAKLKPYGPKFAAPFGYSIFDLADGEGFSIQLHEEEKVEAFHILAVHPRAFVLACTPEAWDEHGDAMVAAWEDGRPADSPIAHRPDPGDTIVIGDLRTVHTVVGCLLEEYATTSYDAVKRLHDQNEGRTTDLPAEDPTAAAALAGLTGAAPRRALRPHDGWATEALPDGGVVVDLPDGGLRGLHVHLGRGQVAAREVRSDHVHTVSPLTGTVMLEVAGRTFDLHAGDTTAVPPRAAYRLEGVHDTEVSITEVVTRTAFADLR
jgi:mannose-6-phosphate isomerase-like protein (cupin superfamily)